MLCEAARTEGETGSEQSVENEMLETWTSSGCEAGSPRVTLWRRTGWETTQNKEQHRHHPSGAQVLWGGERLLRGSKERLRRGTGVRAGEPCSEKGQDGKAWTGTLSESRRVRLTWRGQRGNGVDYFLIVQDLFKLLFKRAFLLICQQVIQINVNNLLWIEHSVG